MKLRNCSRCGRVFAYVGRDLCPACIRQDDEAFDRLREFLADNPRATVEDACRETGLDAERVLRFLRQGRLQLSPSSAIVLECQRCGQRILSGRLCPACLSSISGRAGAGDEEARHEEPAAGAGEPEEDGRRKMAALERREREADSVRGH